MVQGSGLEGSGVWIRWLRGLDLRGSMQLFYFCFVPIYMYIYKYVYKYMCVTDQEGHEVSFITAFISPLKHLGCHWVFSICHNS